MLLGPVIRDWCPCGVRLRGRLASVSSASSPRAKGGGSSVLQLQHGKMVAMEAMQPASPPCPGWLQGIANVNRLRSGGQDSSGGERALSMLCTHGVPWQRLAGARMLASVARHDDGEVIDALLGNTISSADFGERGGLPRAAGARARARHLAAAQQSCAAAATGGLRPVLTRARLAGMHDKASEVRAAAATSAGVLARDTGNPAVIDALVDLFSDSDWTVRSSALKVPFPSLCACALSCCARLRASALSLLCARMVTMRWWQALSSVAGVGSNYCVARLLQCLAGIHTHREAACAREGQRMRLWAI